MGAKGALCQAVGCTRPIEPKYVLCRPCAVAATRDRYPYVEPCPSYVPLPVAAHLDRHCSECGFDSALHPGGGRLRPAKVVIAGTRAALLLAEAQRIFA